MVFCRSTFSSCLLLFGAVVWRRSFLPRTRGFSTTSSNLTSRHSHSETVHLQHTTSVHTYRAYSNIASSPPHHFTSLRYPRQYGRLTSSPPRSGLHRFLPQGHVGPDTSSRRCAMGRRLASDAQAEGMEAPIYRQEERICGALRMDRPVTRVMEGYMQAAGNQRVSAS